jgi:uncharacterized protein YjiS (DUF1127 family)
LNHRRNIYTQPQLDGFRPFFRRLAAELDEAQAALEERTRELAETREAVAGLREAVRVAETAAADAARQAFASNEARGAGRSGIRTVAEPGEYGLGFSIGSELPPGPVEIEPLGRVFRPPADNSAGPVFPLLCIAASGLQRMLRRMKNLARNYKAWRIRKQRRLKLIRELSAYSDGELLELGFSRYDFPAINNGTYQR